MNRVASTQRSPFLGEASCKRGFMGCWVIRHPSLRICNRDGQYPVHAGTPRGALKLEICEAVLGLLLPLLMAALLLAAEVQDKMCKHDARQTKGPVPSWRDSGCSAENMAPSLLTPWNRILLFWAEKQIFTTVFIPCSWAFLQRKAPGTCQQTARHRHPSSKCHPHPWQPRQSSRCWLLLHSLPCVCACGGG